LEPLEDEVVEQPKAAREKGTFGVKAPMLVNGKMATFWGPDRRRSLQAGLVVGGRGQIPADATKCRS
jgi:2-hydroxychromene-2-carboxylate isomerase